jgi:hypothetical protein
LAGRKGGEKEELAVSSFEAATRRILLRRGRSSREVLVVLWTRCQAVLLYKLIRRFGVSPRRLWRGASFRKERVGQRRGAAAADLLVYGGDLNVDGAGECESAGEKVRKGGRKEGESELGGQGR